MEEFLNQILFTLNERGITTGEVIAVSSIGILSILFYLFGIRRTLTYYANKGNLDQITGHQLKQLIGSCLILIFLISAVDVLDFSTDIYPNGYFRIGWDSVLRGLFIIQLARLINLFLVKGINRYYQQKIALEEEERYRLEDITKQNSSKIASQSVRIAVFLLATFLFFQNFQFNPTVFTFHANSETPFNLNLSKVITILIILTLGRVFVWALTQLILLGYYQKNKINLGTQFAVNQLISYFVYVITILTALHYLQVNMTVFWGGLAALLVGVGLGLQQTFNDLFSGLLLLFERGIEVGETIEIDGIIGSLKKIGLRTSIIESRDNITVIVPNSKLVVNNVINWSHYDDKVRFKITIGVAYGTDTALVKQILLETAKVHPSILKRPAALVRFTAFGNSSLDFELLFFSKKLEKIEDIKSDLRFEIDRKFRAAGIEIPFPQQDVWIRKGGNEH
ncbi:MAG: mechanosensitive ion channel family protein [Saprospiraceae bacterium]